MEHLTCKVCGYKQYDEGMVRMMKAMCPGMELYDIPYKCGACLNMEEDE